MPAPGAKVALAHAVALMCGCGAHVGGQVASSGRRGVACPHDAIAAEGICHCPPGLAVLDGACVGPRDVDAYCGAPGGGATAGGVAACTTPRCAPGDGRDPKRALCVPPRAVRSTLARDRAIPAGSVLGCHEGHTLVAHDERVACLAIEDACPRATKWDARAETCVAPAACSPGELRLERGCERILGPPGEGSGPLVDVAAWSRAMLGVDGGEGSALLCRPLAQEPWAFDVGPGGARTVALVVELVFRDNDVTQLSARIGATDEATGTPVAGPGARAAEVATESLLIPLRALGGTATAAGATARVICTIRGGTSPLVLPGGAP